MAEWSKAPDSNSGPRERAWVQIPLLTFYVFFYLFFNGISIYIFFFIFGICMPSVCLLSKSGGKEITFSLVFEAYLEFNCVTVDIYSFIFLSCL